MSQPPPQVHFVVSAPRSGSTWLARSLNTHPRIHATENRLFGMFCQTWQNRSGRSMPRITADKFVQSLAGHSFWSELGFQSTGEFQAELLEHWCDCLTRWQAQRSGKPVIVDKVTPYLGTAGTVLQQIARFFPEARLIHLLRDGRDVVTSGVFDWIGREPDRSEPQARIREEFFVDQTVNRPLTRFLDDASIRTWCRYWTESNQVTGQACQPSGPALPIRYEQMKQDQASVLKTVFQWLDVDDEDNVVNTCVEASSFRKTTGRAAGQADPLAKARRGVSGDWRNYFTRQDARIFQEAAGAMLQQYGYEADDAWVEQCPEQLNLAPADR